MKVMIVLSLLAGLSLAFAGCLESNPQPAPGSGGDSEDPIGPDKKRDGGAISPGEDVVPEPPDGAPDANAADLPMSDIVEDTEEPGDVPEGDVTPQPEYHPLFDFAGNIKIREGTLPTGEVTETSVSVEFRSGPSDPFWGFHLETSGDCAFYQNFTKPVCEPKCEMGLEFCGEDKACHPEPHRVSGGPVTIDGLAVPATLTPGDFDWYTIEWEQPDDLFGLGDDILVSADGDEIPAFEVELAGVGDLAALWGGEYELVDGHDNEFPWTPQGDGSTVELAIVTGHHAQPPPFMIWCSAPDEAGKIVVPQKFVEAFPPAGGVGLFQHFSWANRVNRKVVDGPYGPIEVVVQSQMTFSITH